MESSLQFCYCSLGRTQHTLKGHSGPVSRQREVQETGQARVLWFPQEEKGEAEQAGLGLANVSNFSRLWDKGAAPSRLVPGLEAMGWVHSALQCENPIREVEWTQLTAHEMELTSLQPGPQNWVKTAPKNYNTTRTDTKMLGAFHLPQSFHELKSSYVK